MTDCHKQCLMPPMPNDLAQHLAKTQASCKPKVSSILTVYECFESYHNLLWKWLLSYFTLFLTQFLGVGEKEQTHKCLEWNKYIRKD